MLPRPRGDAVVAARQIRFGNLEIQHRLAFGIILGFDDLPGIVCIGGAETGAFAGLGVHAVVGSTTDSTADETVTCFHSFHATARINEAGSEGLASSRRVIAGYAGFLRSSKCGVRFAVRCGPLCSFVLAAKTVRTGGEGRNRTLNARFSIKIYIFRRTISI